MGDGFHVRQAIRESDRADYHVFLAFIGLVFLVMIALAIYRAIVFGLPI